MKTALARTSPSSEKPPDSRKYLWLATPATEQIGQDRNNALFNSQALRMPAQGSACDADKISLVVDASALAGCFERAVGPP